MGEMRHKPRSRPCAGNRWQACRRRKRPSRRRTRRGTRRPALSRKHGRNPASKPGQGAGSRLDRFPRTHAAASARLLFPRRAKAPAPPLLASGRVGGNLRRAHRLQTAATPLTGREESRILFKRKKKWLYPHPRGTRHPNWGRRAGPRGQRAKPVFHVDRRCVFPVAGFPR